MTAFVACSRHLANRTTGTPLTLSRLECMTSLPAPFDKIHQMLTRRTVNCRLVPEPPPNTMACLTASARSSSRRGTLCACDPTIALTTNKMRQFLATLPWYLRPHPYGGSQASYQVRCQRRMGQGLPKDVWPREDEPAALNSYRCLSWCHRVLRRRSLRARQDSSPGQGLRWKVQRHG